MQSPPGSGLLRTTQRSAPGRSADVLVKSHTFELCSSRTLGECGPGLLPHALRAECGRPGEAGLPGKGRPHGGREPSDPADAREQGRASRAQGAGGRRRSDAREQESSGALAPRTHLGSGRRARARASCRSRGPSSCPFPCLCLLCARTSRWRSAHSTRRATGADDARQVWSEGLDRIWEKFVPRWGERPGCGARAAQGASPVAFGERCRRGVRSRPPGTSGRSVRRSPWLLGLFLSPWEVRCGSRRTGSCRYRLLSWPLSRALAARRGRGIHCPARAPIAQAASAAPLLSSALARSSDKFWGTPRRLFFNCPTTTHLPPAG